MKAIISGASGFIGSALSTALLAKGFQVTRVTQALLYSPADLFKFLIHEQPDYIIHLAAYGNMASQKDSDMMVFANIFGAYNLLKASLTVPYKAFIQVGSSSEYGKKEEAMNERDLLEPQTFYGASKAGATHLAQVFRTQYDLPIVTVRPFSVYGPGEASLRFIPTAIRNMLRGEPFPLEEDANHDWIYIDDFIEALFCIMENPRKVNQGVVNVGAGRMYTNKEVVELLKKISGIQYFVTPLHSMRKGDSPVWLSDNSNIEALGWYPKHTFFEGLKETYDYYFKKYAK